MDEHLITSPAVDVAETEYRRLLGYPRGHEPSARAQELAAWARAWFSTHGQPWAYYRTAEFAMEGDRLAFDGVEFRSPQLRAHLAAAGAERAVLIAVSAGRAAEEHARQLWQEAKPDEYFFLETLASAVVENLVATVNSRVCAEAELRGLAAIPHYSPGYGTWDVFEQNALFELIQSGCHHAFPEPLEVLHSGMLRPKKSLLGIIGLSPRPAGARARTTVPCLNCSFTPCQFRRAPYRHAGPDGRKTPDTVDRNGGTAATPPVVHRGPLTANAAYTINPRALQKWARDRVQLELTPDGGVVARFRYDGTTCSNMGRPLAFEYRIVLGPADSAYRILGAECRPCDGDDGYQSMCEYLRDAEGLMAAIAKEKPLLGQPLDSVLQWPRPSAPSGCYCEADSRAHKWGLALEAIHYALVTQSAESPQSGPPHASRPRSSSSTDAGGTPALRPVAELQSSPVQ